MSMERHDFIYHPFVPYREGPRYRPYPKTAIKGSNYFRIILYQNIIRLLFSNAFFFSTNNITATTP